MPKRNTDAGHFHRSRIRKTLAAFLMPTIWPFRHLPAGLLSATSRFIALLPAVIKWGTDCSVLRAASPACVRQALSQLCAMMCCVRAHGMQNWRALGGRAVSLRAHCRRRAQGSARQSRARSHQRVVRGGYVALDVKDVSRWCKKLANPSSVGASIGALRRGGS